MSAAPQEALEAAFAQETEFEVAPGVPWQVIVWNDPVNLMSYVTYVFRSYFGFSKDKAHRLMMQVHEQGKTVVFTGSREEAEKHTQAMHGWGLWATLERVSE
ncbi:ATP-dependent Clp protease adapter ClpS [Rothia amarae]|uniref:ATP-dependent Clp protease adapter ClpS n=1 Tax=Rothia amarae TaxID=169480 RepID=UPI0033E20DDD